MYRIIGTDGTELGMTDAPVYIKYGRGGCLTTTCAEDAIGIALHSVAYNLFGHEEIEGADTVILSKTDGGALLARQKDATDELILAMLEG